MQWDNRDIYDRIEKALKAKKLSANAASIAAGLGKDVIRDIKRKPEIEPTISTMEALAKVLDLTPEFLIFGIKKTRRRENRSMRIIGEVAAGLWLDLSAEGEREVEQHPVPFHPNWPEEAQYGLIVVGTSVNKVAGPGDVLQCVDRGISGLEPQENDLVIVERRRAQSGQKEVTAKRYRNRGKTIELHPESTDKRWSEPLIFDPRRATGDEEVAIIAVVVGVYRPLKRIR